MAATSLFPSPPRAWRLRVPRFIAGSLQFKILLLVLMPLILSSSCLLVLEGYDRYRDSQVWIEQQRERLLASEVAELDTAMAEIEATARSELMATLLRLWLIASLINLTITAVAIWVARRTVARIRDTASLIHEVAGEVAEGRGDLTRRLPVTSRDEIGDLARQFNGFLAKMESMLGEVRRGAEAVYQAAEEIARSSESLASRTEQAAASLQQTSSAMEEITATVANNAEHTQQAERLVTASAGIAEQGQAAMNEVERTMGDIHRSSERIGDIVTLIDSIAFQTNILALNASVEAARAGEHGRGFAVVAQEVRTLAQRSAEAAKEIGALIEASGRHTQEGSRIVQRAGATMREILDSVHQVTAVIAEINAGSREQSIGIGEVNVAVGQLDGMTQQNASMVEQNARTARRMREQAEALKALIGGFTLGEGAPPSDPVAWLEERRGSSVGERPPLAALAWPETTAS